jgi:hypothetical protein
MSLENLETKELKLDGFVDERSLVCIANFVNGFAAGWFCAVPEAFREALDIKLAQRMIPNPALPGKTVAETMYTQGNLFSFNKGDVFYDTPEAYADEKWSEIIKTIRFCIQIKKTTPSTLVETKTWATVEPVPIIEDKSDKPKKHLHKLVYTRSRIQYGEVSFVMLEPDLLKTKLVEVATYETNQEYFVRFLQFGSLLCNDGTKYDFTTGSVKHAARQVAPTEPLELGI